MSETNNSPMDITVSQLVRELAADVTTRGRAAQIFAVRIAKIVADLRPLIPGSLDIVFEILFSMLKLKFLESPPNDPSNIFQNILTDMINIETETNQRKVRLLADFITMSSQPELSSTRDAPMSDRLRNEKSMNMDDGQNQDSPAAVSLPSDSDTEETPLRVPSDEVLLWASHELDVVIPKDYLEDSLEELSDQESTSDSFKINLPLSSPRTVSPEIPESPRIKIEESKLASHGFDAIPPLGVCIKTEPSSSDEIQNINDDDAVSHSESLTLPVSNMKVEFDEVASKPNLDLVPQNGNFNEFFNTEEAHDSTISLSIDSSSSERCERNKKKRTRRKQRGCRKKRRVKKKGTST